ncbi:MAG: hypothetical protein B6I20_08510 [Bacteroidetes bacterium 4572_117]|nr:MAG: hypothetical protein B6I20_08510 [Bacteroidetes bacterium 4572_117]
MYFVLLGYFLFQIYTYLSSQKDIIKGCVEGKTEAQGGLFKEYSKMLFGVCIRYTKDRSAAEDILHEGFIKIFKNIASYKGKGSFEGWMRRIMVNTALERYRKKFQMYPISEMDLDSKMNTNVIVSELSAQELLLLIKELPPAYKMVFNLYAIDGYSHKEIGEMLNISVGTSKSNLSRARKILQTKVNQHFIMPEERKRC